VSFVIRGIYQFRERPRAAYCEHNLKHISLALHNYHQVNGCFPPAYIANVDGKPNA